jgi:ADP-ribose pyrophosphatase
MPDFPFCTPPKKLTQERFVNLFSTEICTAKGRGSWIFASRKKEPGASVRQADAAVVVAVVQRGDEAHLVMTREFRAPLGTYELSLPSGLIDAGESATDAAIREFNEETGMTLSRVVHVSPPLASSAGLTDETVSLVYGEGTGVISRAHQTEHEDIDVRLVSIAEIHRLLASEQDDIVSSRLYPILVGYASAGVIELPLRAT